MNSTGRVIAVAALLVSAMQAGAQAPAPPPSKPISTSLGMVVFPAKGQTRQQQAQDEGECYAWSKGQTGVDPMAPPPAATQPAAQPAKAAPAADGSRVRGDAPAYSDLDVVVVLKGPVRFGEDLHAAVKALYPLQLDADFPIHPLPVDEYSYEAEDFALYRNVQRDRGGSVNREAADPWERAGRALKTAEDWSRLEGGDLT